MLSSDVRTVILAERFEILVELAAIDRDLRAVEQQFGMNQPDIQAARRWQQRLCRVVLAQLLTAGHTETVH
jgi:hypothetical protein